MLRLQGLKVLRLIALSGLLFGVRAFAQFEVAPDHFDSTSASHKNTASKKAKTGRAATTHPLRNVSVTTGPVVQAGQNGGANARGAAQRRQPRRNLQRVDHARVAATRTNHNAEEPSVAVSPQ
jgi:hypothetical protein